MVVRVHSLLHVSFIISCHILIPSMTLYVVHLNSLGGNYIGDTGVKILLESLLLNCKDIRELK